MFSNSEMSSITNVNVLLQQFVITKYMLGKCKLKLYKLNLILQDLEKTRGFVSSINDQSKPVQQTIDVGGQ